MTLTVREILESADVDLEKLLDLELATPTDGFCAEARIESRGSVELHILIPTWQIEDFTKKLAAATEKDETTAEELARSRRPG